jgi:hypothetical protein
LPDVEAGVPGKNFAYELARILKLNTYWVFIVKDINLYKLAL